MNRHDRKPLWLIAVVVFSLAFPLQAGSPVGDSRDLKLVEKWEKVANGVFRTVVGNHDGEMHYSDLAAASPKIETLNRLPDVPISKALKSASFRLLADGKVLVRIPTEPGEKIYGYGLQFDNTMKSGQIVELKVDHFKKGGGATHAPVPFYISSKGYGVLFNTAKYIKIHNQVGSRKDSKHNPEEVDRNPPADEKQAGPWLALPPGDAVEAFIHGKGLEMVGFTGTSFQDIVARYNLFSGGGAMPPLWGLGFWHRTPAKYSAEQTAAEIAEFDQHRIPLDVIGLEPGWQSKSYPCTYEWQKKRFPDPGKFAKQLLDDGIRLNLWVNPYISKHSRIYEKMKPLSGSHLVWLGIVPDYTLPEARQLLVDQHKEDHFDIGISGYKIDECDGYDFWLWPDYATFPSGTSAEVMRQTYGMQLQSLMHKELFVKNNQRTYSQVRASNGAASSYPFVIYSDSYGHNQYVTGLSSASLSGILWCPEIRSARNEREWINRMHTVCFSPLAQLNAWASKTKPWSYKNATDAVRNTIELRMQLLPYLYTAFANYNQQGIPPVRSMLLETGEGKDQSKEQERKLDGETDPYADGFHQKITEDNSLYMFGPDILVAPFLNNSTKRQVQLPAGNWYDFYTGKLLGNGNKITITAKQFNDLPPLLVKEGALIPMLTKSVMRTKDIQGAAIEIRHYGKKDGTCQLYEDDGQSYDFEKGAYTLRTFALESGQLKQKIVKKGAKPLYGDVSLRQMTK
ncbi:TIM-barrel domain-containing protein [Oceaniferula marina]|nr:TIM-barrel domain-containing protein [Oceaniferula marina]